MPLPFLGVTLWLPLPLLALYGSLALLWVGVVALLLPRWPSWRPGARLATYATLLGVGPVALWLLFFLPQHWYWLRPI